MLDFIYRANAAKPREEQIPSNEFYNEAINTDVDLKKQVLIFLQEWEKAKYEQREFDSYSFFTLYNYPWILNPHRKGELQRILGLKARE